MSTMNPELSLKVVIRCRDFTASRHFYADIIKLTVVEEWEEKEGRGCIFGFGEDGQQALLEVYQMSPRDKRYRSEFEQTFENDKIDLQLKTSSLEAWIQELDGKWAFEGPRKLPWGQHWIKLRDPDHLLVAIYEENIEQSQ